MFVLVSPDGVVTSVRPIDGPAALREAAVDAVRQWRFAPYSGRLVHERGEAIAVNFSLQSSPRDGDLSDAVAREWRGEPR